MCQESRTILYLKINHSIASEKQPMCAELFGVATLPALYLREVAAALQFDDTAFPICRALLL